MLCVRAIGLCRVSRDLRDEPQKTGELDRSRGLAFGSFPALARYERGAFDPRLGIGVEGSDGLGSLVRLIWPS